MFYIVYITIIFVGVFLIAFILRLLMKKRLNESNALLWLFIGLIIVLAGLFPKIVVELSDFFKISYPPALIFTFSIIILLLIVLKNTITISELTAKMQQTAMEVSILKKEIINKEGYIKELESSNKDYDEDLEEVAQTYTLNR